MCIRDSLDTAVGARTPVRWRTPILGALLIAVLTSGLVAVLRQDRTPAAPAIRYEEVFDDTRAISVRVPAAWSQHWGNGWHPPQGPFYRRVNVGPGMNASPNVSDWFTGAAVPGLFAGASARVVTEGRFSPEFMRQYFGPSGCTDAGTSAFTLDRLGLTGVQGEWRCPAGVRWRYAYGWPGHHRYVLAIEIKILPPYGDQVWTEALNTITVHTEPR